MEIDKIKNTIELKIDRIADTDLKNCLSAVFKELTNAMVNELKGISQSVEGGINSFLAINQSNNNFNIYQSYLKFDEPMPKGFAEMQALPPNVKHLGQNRYKIKVDNFTNMIHLPILIFDNSCLKAFEESVKITTPNSNIDFKIEKNVAIQNKISELKQLFENNRLVWQLPYLPYNYKAYQVVIGLNLPAKDGETELEIDFGQVNETDYLPFGRLIWNVEPVEKKQPRCGVINKDNQDYYRYDIKDIKDSQILLEDLYETIDRQPDHCTITIVKEENHNYNYLKINKINDLSKLPKPQSNSTKDGFFLPIGEIKTRAELESYFHAFSDLGGLSLISIERDDSMLYSQPANCYFSDQNEFSSKRCKMILKIKAAANDLFAQEKANFICAKIEEKLPFYWCIAELTNE